MLHYKHDAGDTCYSPDIIIASHQHSMKTADYYDKQVICK